MDTDAGPVETVDRYYDRFTHNMDWPRIRAHVLARGQVTVQMFPDDDPGLFVSCLADIAGAYDLFVKAGDREAMIQAVAG